MGSEDTPVHDDAVSWIKSSGVELQPNDTFSSPSKVGIPFIHRFRTDRKHYVYDVNTNRLIEVAPVVYGILGDWGQQKTAALRRKYEAKFGQQAVDQALDEIKAARKQEGLFLSDKPQSLDFGYSQKELRDLYETKLNNVVLETTKQCNLRCHYCPRISLNNGHRKRMSPATARAAIDFLFHHSRKTDQPLYVGFYGGEPLKEWPLVQECVRYAQWRLGSDCKFFMTTNGTLMDEAIAGFLARLQFSVIVSIDGPQRIHDRHRVDARGNGSYQRAVAGLRALSKAYHQVWGEIPRDKLKVNMVITPPFDYDAVSEFLKDEPGLSPRIGFMLNTVATDHTDFLKYCDPLDGRLFPSPASTQSWIRYREGYRTKLLAGKPEGSIVGKSLFEKRLLQIHKRPLGRGPRSHYYPNGCCIPATRKLFIAADGSLRICERAHGTPPVGTLSTGFDRLVLEHLIHTYNHESLADCRDCWAVALCILCFGQAYPDHRFSREYKRTFCEPCRRRLEDDLRLYCSILEEDKHALDFMEIMELH
jgi:uncharacterized protein